MKTLERDIEESVQKRRVEELQKFEDSLPSEDNVDKYLRDV
jgi:hypothetical protein